MKNMDVSFLIIKLSEELKNGHFSFNIINILKILINLTSINLKKGKR